MSPIVINRLYMAALYIMYIGTRYSDYNDGMIIIDVARFGQIFSLIFFSHKAHLQSKSSAATVAIVVGGRS